MKTTLLAVSIALFVCGCSSEPSQPTGPSYAEAVATYQAEVALLDSLEAKVAAIDARHQERVSVCRRDSIGLITESEFDSVARTVASMSPKIVLEKSKAPAPTGSEDHVAFVRQILIKYRSLRESSFNEILPEIERQKQRVAVAKKARDLATP